MSHSYSLRNPSRPFKRLSPAIANTSQRSKRRKTSHRGDADTEDQHPTTSHTTQTDNRGECENPDYGYSCHQVFLSHSGHQKSFVEQLFVDLQRENISCFFDKDSESLPKGENFPTRIFEAAQKCRVGVVVLSDEFISSKWPMEELCAFVGAQNSVNSKLKILPLFFGLTPQLLSEKLKKKDSLKRSWQKLLRSQKRPTNLDQWVSALQTLRRINGVNYVEQNGEVAYRAEIARQIRRLVRPRLRYDESSVQGKERLCQIVARLLNNRPCEEHGVKIAGFYGVAGIGKTTLARIACNFYSNDFDGRVLHVELGKGMPIERLKCALQILTDASETVVKSVTDVEQGIQGWWLFNQRMRGRKVFLALDNISDLPGQIEEAQKYLGAVRSAGNESTILLMARSSTILRRFILKGEGWCMHVPSVEEEEAIAILLQLTPLQVSKLSSEEQDIAKKCALKCYFHWHSTQYDGYDVPYSAYHPLALKAFGALLYDKFNSGSDLTQWIEIQSLTKPWRSEIFSVLEESFERLRKDCGEIFMLLCLYLPQYPMSSEAAFNWLALTYDREVEDVILAIDELKRKGFVEIIMESSPRLYIHDLHIEFAEKKADGAGKWISVKERRHIPASLQQYLSSDRPSILAMKFVNCHFECPGFVNDELFRSVLVLHLQDMPRLKILNLSPMRILRSITIVGCGGMQEIRGLEILTSLVYFVVKGCPTNVQFSGIERLLALQHLQIDAKLQERTTESSQLSWTSFPPLQSASVVGTIRLDHIENGTRRLDLRACSKLRTIKLSQCDMVHIDLPECIELREIEIVDCKNLREISLFSPNLVGLETEAICSTLKPRWLPKLGPAFSSLSELRLVGMHSLKELPTLTGLTALEFLRLEGMHSLKELPTLTGLTALKYLRLERMHSLKELPTLTGLTALQNLWLEGMHSLKELPTLTGLTALEDLWLEGMHNLKELPTLTGLTSLKYLWLEGMHSLKELPTLTGLTAVVDLQLQGMHSLKEIPTLTGLTALQNLKLEGMHSLKELPTLIGLTALEYLWLKGMHSLKELPTLTGLTELKYIQLQEMNSLKELPTLTGLTALQYLLLEGMHSLKELPTLTELTALEIVALEGMQRLKELPTLTGFNTCVEIHRMWYFRRSERLASLRRV